MMMTGMEAYIPVSYYYSSKSKQERSYLDYRIMIMTLQLTEGRNIPVQDVNGEMLWSSDQLPIDYLYL